MDMSGMSMGSEMGGMSMGSGVPNLFYLQKMFWAVVGAAIGLATAVNVYNELLCRQRISAARRGHSAPAKPTAFLPSSVATTAAICREASYSSIPIRLTPKLYWSTPQFGRVLLVLAEFVVVIVLCFYKLHPKDQWQWEDIGYRTGFIASCQLPLIVLLAGKNNIVGFLVGTSYERLSWLHRWAARILLLTVTLHMGYWFADWYRYDYIKVKLTTDAITKRGFAAWVILVWIVFSSMAPVRRWNYEFFVVQHIITYAGFLASVYLHLPAEVKVWVWITIGLVILDRTIRTFTVLYTNTLVLHQAKREGFWASKATFEPLDAETTRIVISKPPLSWKAGQHVLLSCHTIAPLQSHPFTIASIPSDGKMEFLIKSKNGGTRRYLRHAEKQLGLPITDTPVELRHRSAVTLEGPYGRIRPLQQFDSVMFVAGSSGGTFTVPLLREIVRLWKTGGRDTDSPWSLFNPRGFVTRYVRFIWVVKSRAQYKWFSHQLINAIEDVEFLRSQGQDVELEISIYVTCDQDFVSGTKGVPQQSGCDLRQDQPAKPSSTRLPMPQREENREDDISSQPRSHPVAEPEPKASCGPDGTCCCQTTIEDEDGIKSTNAACECCCSNSRDLALSDEKKPTPVVESISSDQNSDRSLTWANANRIDSSPRAEILMLSGRPQPKNLIRKTLEQALGESAVVVCGPKGLVANVRQSVVSLSDERAIHKGTGAQGVYLHAEAFDY
ncbi:MAG: hypothetical protein Q9191_005586 [Dirinaria sp. TL-2023a]